LVWAFALLPELVVLTSAARAAERAPIDFTKIPAMRWVGPGVPGTYKAYRARRVKRPLAIKAASSASQPLPAALGGQPRVLVIVNRSLLPDIQANLDRYAADVQGLGYQVGVYECAYGTAEELKAFIKGQSTDLVGCVFFGDVPCAWYEVQNDHDYYGYASFPCDLFLSDLDGEWSDNETTSPMQAGVYDGHSAGSGDEGPEIFVGRVDASRVTWGKEANLVNAYLDKLHSYYTGSIPQTNHALAYMDDDYSGPSYWYAISQAYPSYEVIRAPDSSRDDYRDNRLASAAYEFIHIATHGTSGGHTFTRGGWLSSRDVKSVPPRALFYNLFACSASRFTDSNYLSGAYIFNSSTTSLTTVGSTKTGGMLAYDDFYGPLGEHKSIGQALNEWFNARAPYSQFEVYWYFGMTIVGDPLVVPVAQGLSEPGPLDIDLTVMTGGQLNLDGPAPRSLCIVGIDPNGNAPDTVYAIQIGTSPNSGWLHFVNSGAPHNRDDVYADGAAPEWHTAADWAGKRLRGLTPDTSYTFYAKAKDTLDNETALVEVQSCSTNQDLDVNRNGGVTVLDLLFTRDASLSAGEIGTTGKAWASDVDDSGDTTSADTTLVRNRILGTD